MKIGTIISVAFIIIVLLFSACTPQKRLHRLLALHPELTAKETIHIKDSIFIPQTRIDTLLREYYLQDTITITKEKLAVKLFKIHDTIYLNAWNEPDTVIIEKEIPVEKIIHEIPSATRQEKIWGEIKDDLFILLILLLIGIIVGWMMRK